MFGSVGSGCRGHVDFHSTFGSGFPVTDGAVDGAVVRTGQRAALGRLGVASERWWGRCYRSWRRDVVMMLDRGRVVVDDLLDSGDLLAVGKSLEEG